MSLSYRNEIPYIEEKNLSDLTQSIQTPFYVYSQKIITEFFLKLKKNLQKDIYYSVKANSNQAIISLLNSLGAGADVVSIEELKRVIKAGVSKNKIIYEGVGKSENDLSYAIKNEIKQINIESIEELHLIDKIANSLNQKPNVGIRINPNIDAQTLDKISTGRKTDKFGIDFNQLEEIIEILKSMKNINFSGLSCHAGSQMSDLKIYEKIFIKIIKAIKIFESHNLKIENLNLGGGLSVVYEKNQNEFEVNKLAKLLEKFFPKSNQIGVRTTIFSERYFDRPPQPCDPDIHIDAVDHAHPDRPTQIRHNPDMSTKTYQSSPRGACCAAARKPAGTVEYVNECFF